MRRFCLFVAVVVSCSPLAQNSNTSFDASSSLPALPNPDASQSKKIQIASTDPRCPSESMVFIDGDYCPSVEQKCLRWLDVDKSPEANFGIGPLRCAEFQKPSVCKSQTREHKTFCIDAYEYPNKKDEYPLVTIDWYSAQKKCEAEGKRLCTAKEWTFACEGESMKPYPYGDGYNRDEKVCDQEHDSMDPSKPRSEWPKYNYSHRSGSMSECKSEYNVFDMTANVDEWVLNEGGKKDGDPYFSGLKGGYWSYKIRSRCRPMTTVHSPGHSFYQQGFRCCSNAKSN